MALPRSHDATQATIPDRRTSATITQAGDRTQLALLAIALLVVGSVFSMLFSVTTGASDASILDVISNMAGSEAALQHRDRIIIFDIRLPRAILGFLIGASLAVSGAVMQGLFRNPLADPGLVGVSSGASLGAVAMIVLGGGIASAARGASRHLRSAGWRPSAAASSTTLLLYRIATRHGQTSVATMLLAGIALGALALAPSRDC